MGFFTFFTLAEVLLMKRWLALGWLLAFLPLVASARQIPVKTVPVATGDQFLIFPSVNMSMGGISIPDLLYTTKVYGSKSGIGIFPECP